MKQKTTFANLLASNKKKEVIEDLFFNKFEKIYKILDFCAFDLDGVLNITWTLSMRGIGIFNFELKQDGLDFIVNISLLNTTFKKMYSFETQLKELKRDFESLNYFGLWGKIC